MVRLTEYGIEEGVDEWQAGGECRVSAQLNMSVSSTAPGGYGLPGNIQSSRRRSTLESRRASRYKAAYELRMNIRGLELPNFDTPQNADKLLSDYLATTADSLYDLLDAGARWPDLLGADQRSMEIFAGCRALHDASVSPDIYLSSTKFAYLLCHWEFLDDAFRVLEAINSLREENEPADDRYSLLPCDDPFYVAGLMCTHNEYPKCAEPAKAIEWYRRSLARGEDLDYSGPLHGAIGLCYHYMLDRHAAQLNYRIALETLQNELDIELRDEEPNFHHNLRTAIELIERQDSRASKQLPPDAVMTRSGWLEPDTGKYEDWSSAGYIGGLFCSLSNALGRCSCTRRLDDQGQD